MIDLKRIRLEQFKYLLKVFFLRELLFPVLSLPLFPSGWKYIVHVKFLHPFIYKNIFYPPVANGIYNEVKQKVLSKDWQASDIRNSFKRRGILFSSLPDKLFELVIHAATNQDNAKGLRIQAELTEIINEIKYDYKIAFSLKELYNILIRCGLFVVGLNLRNRIVEFIKEDLSNSDFTERKFLLVSLGLMLEMKEMSVFDLYFRERKKYLSKRDVELLLMLKTTLFCRDPGAIYVSSVEDKKFLTFTSDKFIAIVGPAQTNEKDGARIDEFNRVVRISYNSKDVRINPLIKGSKINISYLLSPGSLYLFNNPNLKPDKDINWLVFQSNKIGIHYLGNLFRSNIKFVSSINGPKYRSIVNYNPVLFNSTLNSLPHVLLDLLRFNPGSIYVYHCDFMLTVMRFKGYYQGSYSEFNKVERRLNRAIQSFSAGHDPFLQFNIVKTLYKANKISGDSRFVEVINYSSLTFAENLQESYGEAGRFKLN